MRIVPVLVVLGLLVPSATTHATTPTLPLIEAARQADVATLRALLQRRTDVNAAGPDGTTALHWAAYRGDAEAVDLLLKAGASAKAANRYGVTPLSLACMHGTAAVVERLLAAGADANATMIGGETVLMTAARTGNADVVKALLARGAKVEARESSRQQTALMWAAAEGNSAAMKLLIEAGADIRARSNERDFRNYEPLRGGSAIGDVESGVHVEFSPLLFAVRAGKVDAIKVLLDAGADVNETVPDGTSALVIAAINAQWEAGAYLLERGANPNAAGQGWNALHQVARTRTFNLGNVPHPMASGSLSSLDFAKKLLAHGIDINARMTKEIRNDGYRFQMSRLGATAFLIASKGADAPLMRILAAQGADTRMANSAGTTPLMAAAGVDIAFLGEDTGTHDDATEAVKVALECPHDLNATNNAGWTALHGAARRGALPIVEALIARGAGLSAKTKNGWTPLTVALGWKNGRPLFLNEQRQFEAAIVIRRAMQQQGVAMEEDKDALALLEASTASR